MYLCIVERKETFPSEKSLIKNQEIAPGKETLKKLCVYLQQKTKHMNKREIKFKPLVPGQIEVRPTDTKTKGAATLLLYIDSRSAADILNETVGEFNWTIEYKPVGDTVFGRLSIWDEEKQMWIFREDTGEESNISALKGMSSDILKRCLARFGCDYLYHTPRIKVKDLPASYYYNDRLTMTFSVREIQWDENKNCTKLVIVDKFGKEVYNYSGEEECKPVKNESREQYKPNSEILREFCSKKKTEEGVDQDDLLRFFKWYKDRVDEYSNTLKPEIIWEKWQSTKR